jgi:hypothetical protein
MMQFCQAKSRAKATNKVALEEEKEKDAAEKAVEELKRQLQPKRPHTHAHELLAEVDNWDLSVHCRWATRVQNHRKRTSTGQITSAMLVAQHLRAIFCNKDWDMEHSTMTKSADH